MPFAEDWSWLPHYAAWLSQLQPVLAGFTLPVTVRSDRLRGPKAFHDYWMVQGRLVEFFVRGVEFSSLLLGAPGAGKSYALRAHAAQFADNLVGATPKVLPLVAGELRIPVLIDLKRYAGSFQQLLPEGLDPNALERLIEAGRASFLVDSFNEAPREYHENRRLPNDLAEWIGRSDKCRWIIASRTDEGLDFFPGERFRIDDIDESFVRQQLADRRADLGQRHAEDLVALLRKPIFFSAFLNKRLKLTPGGTHPAKAIESMLESYAADLQGDLGFAPALAEAWGTLAAEAIGSGHELLSKQALIAALGEQLAGPTARTQAGAGVEWLLSRGLLLEFDRGRVAFYHQAITELIAAKYVAGRLADGLDHLDELLATTRWDESLCLVMHYLNPSLSRTFLETLVARDIQLACRAVRFSEFDRSEMVGRLLDVIVDRDPEIGRWDYRFFRAVDSLPVDSVHAEKLRRLLKLPGYSGSAAAGLLLRALGSAAIGPVLDAVFARPGDYSLGSDAGKALAGHMTHQWISPVFDLIESCAFPVDRPLTESGVAQMMAGAFQAVEPAAIVAEFHRRKKSVTLIAMISKWAADANDPVSLRLLVELLVEGRAAAIIPLYFRASFGEGPRAIVSAIESMEIATLRKQLLAALTNEQGAQWAVQLIELLCAASGEMADWRDRSIGDAVGVVRVALLSIAASEREKEFWAQLEELFVDQARLFADWEYRLLHVLAEKSWIGREALLLRLLERRDAQLTEAILGPMGTFVNIQLSWQWVEGMLGWMDEQKFIDRIREFVWAHADEQCLEQMIAAFNLPDVPHRGALERLLESRTDLPAAKFTEESLSYLVGRVDEHDYHSPHQMLLATIASEELIESRLVGRAHETQEPFCSNLRAVLRLAGEHHRRRFA